MTIKKQYEQPELTVFGTVEELTQAKTSGTKFDTTYIQGTPVPPGGVTLS